MSEAASLRQLVVFTLQGEQYALPIHEVHEIIRYTAPRSIATCTDWVRGVISLRGRIVPVYDLATRLGVTAQLDDEAKIVIVESGGETAGVIVESVEEVLTVGEDQIEAAPAADSTLIESIVRVEDRLIVVLTLSTMLSTPELALAA